jgi:plasmid stabilization system protein ParE
MISVDFSPQAQHDLQKIKRWYNRKQKRLGVSFVHEIDSKLEGLAKTPLMHGVYYQDIVVLRFTSFHTRFCTEHLMNSSRL